MEHPTTGLSFGENAAVIMVTDGYSYVPIDDSCALTGKYALPKLSFEGLNCKRQSSIDMSIPRQKSNNALHYGINSEVFGGRLERIREFIRRFVQQHSNPSCQRSGTHVVRTDTDSVLAEQTRKITNGRTNHRAACLHRVREDNGDTLDSRRYNEIVGPSQQVCCAVLVQVSTTTNRTACADEPIAALRHQRLKRASTIDSHFANTGPVVVCE